jgi:hypothetical protein
LYSRSQGSTFSRLYGQSQHAMTIIFQWITTLIVGRLEAMAAFRPEAFVDKLNKLNASQQSIETISQWCIFFRKVFCLNIRFLCFLTHWMRNCISYQYCFLRDAEKFGT